MAKYRKALEAILNLIEPEEDVRDIPIEEVNERLKKSGIDPEPLIRIVKERIARSKEGGLQSEGV